MREIDVSILDDIFPVLLPTAQTADRQERVCYLCGQTIENESLECPSCGAVNLDKKRRRKENNRPTREAVTEVLSENYNGKYRIFKNSDKTLSCNCLSFLLQRDVQNGTGFSTCKHIRNYLTAHPEFVPHPAAEKQW